MPKAIITQSTPTSEAQNFITESEITVESIVNEYNFNLDFSEGNVISLGTTLSLNEFKEPEIINGVVQTPKVIITYV